MLYPGVQDSPSTPMGERTEPDESFVFAPGSHIVIYWTNNFYGNDINSIDFIGERNFFDK